MVEKKEPTKYYGSPRWSYELYDCSMPMTFDTYSNCGFGCLYCFSQFQKGIGQSKDNYLNKKITAVNVEKVKKLFRGEIKNSQFNEYIEQRKTLQWGGLTDPFCNIERSRGVTLELLEFFHEIKYPICFSTKGVFWTEDERYMKYFRDNDFWNVKFSIITMDEEKAKWIEKGVPTPTERLAAMKRLTDNNLIGGVTLRLRPFIIGISTPSYKEVIRKAAEAGATAISTEFFCLDVRSLIMKENMKVFDSLTDMNTLKFYKQYSDGNGYLRLSRKVKEIYIKDMKKTCDEVGMRFYVSDAHFKEECANGSCCGLSEDWNYSHGQFTEALLIAKKNGFVSWGDISHDMKHLENVPYVGAEGFNSGSNQNRAKYYGLTMKDYIHHLWNDTKQQKGIYQMYEKILTPIEKDENGDLIYKYNG